MELSMHRLWWKIALLLLIVIAAVVARHLSVEQYLNIEDIKTHRAQLLLFIRAHYLQAVISFICLFICSALFLPGALALTVAGGMLFGTVPATIYANIGATAGAVLAFLIARSALAGSIQQRFKAELRRFNAELSRHGANYLLVLRMLPIAPFFVINYCAGITKIPLRTFIWTTSLGMLPGALIHAFIGHQLRQVNAASDIFSWKILLALLLLAVFALLPVMRHHLASSNKSPQ
jgi:uncharacterized membrane protein YdjX (TVP38/TMEM64 family)